MSDSSSTSTAIIPPPTLPSSSSVTLAGLDCRVTFTLNRDLVLACEDQARSQGIGLAEWFQQVTNDALANYLGLG